MASRKMWCAAFVLLCASAAFAQEQVVRVTVEGTRQGKFAAQALAYEHGVITARESGSGMATGRSAATGVVAPRDAATGQASGSAVAPRDVASGLPTGRRQYEPIKIMKVVSSPQLKQALVTQEPLTTVVLQVTKQGAVEQTIKLSDALVASINPGAGGDDVTFTYQKIEMTGRDGKTMAVDDWSR
jgi:type VI secretion system secreted protein Hcp